MKKPFSRYFTMRDAIGLFLVIAFIGAIIALLWKAIPESNEQLLSYMLGQLSGFVAGVVGYHYITKAGEKELDELRTTNTAKALDAIKEAQRATPGAEPDALQPGDEVTLEKPQ